MAGSWRRRAWVPLVAVALLWLLPLGGRLLPLWRDATAVQTLLLAVAADWRDFGEARARERLMYELDARGVGPQLTEGACVFQPSGAGPRPPQTPEAWEVRCAWEVGVVLPWVDRTWTLSFVRGARISPEGRVTS